MSIAIEIRVLPPQKSTPSRVLACGLSLLPHLGLLAGRLGCRGMDAAQPAFSNVRLRADLHSRNARALLYLLYDMATHPYRSVRRPRSPGTGGVADNSRSDSGEVRIKVLAAGTGFTDTFIRRARYPDFEISSPVFEKACADRGHFPHQDLHVAETEGGGHLLQDT